MLDKAISLLKDLLTALAAFVIGYTKGKKDVTHANTQAENQKLADGLNAALSGDYSPDAVRDRMRDKDGD